MDPLLQMLVNGNLNQNASSHLPFVASRPIPCERSRIWIALPCKWWVNHLRFCQNNIILVWGTGQVLPFNGAHYHYDCEYVAPQPWYHFSRRWASAYEGQFLMSMVLLTRLKKRVYPTQSAMGSIVWRMEPIQLSKLVRRMAIVSFS